MRPSLLASTALLTLAAPLAAENPITGNVRLAGTVTATGQGAIGARLAGDVTGAMAVQGAITSTGYRHTVAPADTSKLDADDLLQGGSAVMIEGNVTGGIILAVPPKDNSTADTDEDDDGIEDSKEGSAAVTTYGSAPAMVIGSDSRATTIGAIAGNGTGFGVQIDGTVSGNGVYAGVSGNGLVIGGRGGAVTVAGGIGIAGAVTALPTPPRCGSARRPASLKSACRARSRPAEDRPQLRPPQQSRSTRERVSRCCATAARSGRLLAARQPRQWR